MLSTPAEKKENAPSFGGAAGAVVALMGITANAGFQQWKISCKRARFRDNLGETVSALSTWSSSPSSMAGSSAAATNGSAERAGGYASGTRYQRSKPSTSATTLTVSSSCEIVQSRIFTGSCPLCLEPAGR